MNDDRDFELRVISVVGGMAPSRGPEDLLEDIFAVTGSSRPRPRWWAWLRERPMRYDSQLVSGSPLARSAMLFAATLLLLVALAGVALAGAQLLGRGQTWVVAADGSGDFTTVAEAVAAAGDGDTVLVRPGRYAESFTVRSDITLRGEGPRAGVVIAPAASDRTVIIQTDTYPQRVLPVGVDLELVDAVIENLELQARVPMVGLVVNGGRVRLDDVGISNAPDEGLALSLLVAGGSSTTVMGADLDHLIQVREASSLSVDESRIDDMLDAAGPGHVGVSGSHFGPGGGLRTSDHATATVSGSHFEAATVTIGKASQVELRENSFRGATETAITVANEGSRATIDGNDVRDARAGIAIGPGTVATVTGNTVCGNQTNLLASSDARTEIHDNDISEDCPGE